MMIKRYILLILLLMPLTLQAQDGAAGSVHIIKGLATATSAEGDIRRIRKGSDLYSNETISTASGSYARLQLKD